VLAAALLSLTDFDIYAVASLDNLRFLGLRNYRALLADPLFRIALYNTATFVVIGGPLSIGVSLSAALLLNHPLARWQGLFRAMYFLPVVTTLVAVAVVWRALYHPRVGLLNQALGWLGLAPIDWLGDPSWAMPAIIVMAVWKNFGFNMIIFLAGLQSIPKVLYEAAAVDGAGGWQQFRRITLPMLAPTFAFVTIMTLIGYCQVFAEPYVMTQGGPSNATLSIVLLMYKNGFQWWNMGYGAAVAFVLFAIMLVLTVAATRWRAARLA
jgi:multiple sugar transport system permease protein